MSRSVFFAGRVLTVPQAAAEIDISALNVNRIGGLNNLYVFATGVGVLEPGKVHLITDSNRLRRLLHPSSEALDAGRLVLDPSPTENGAPYFYLVLTNPATQSTFTLQRSAVNSVKLTSRGWGAWTKQVSVKVEAGTASGTKKLTTTYLGEVFVQDNIGRKVLSIRYVGAGSAATMTIVQDTATPSNAKLTTTVTGTTGENLDLGFSLYTSVEALAEAINKFGGGSIYTATFTSDTSGRSTDAISIDPVAAQDIKTAAYMATANWQDLLDRVNKENPYFSAGAPTGTISRGAPDNVAVTFLSGGADGTANSTTWTDALDEARVSFPKPDLILTFSTDQSIQILGDSFAKEVKGRHFTGNGLQADWSSQGGREAALSAIKAASRALNSPRTFNPGIGIRLLREDISQVTGSPDLDRTRLVDARYTAALYAGIAAGGAPSKPLTRKALRCVGLEVKDLQEAELADLIIGGVCPPFQDPVHNGGYVVCRQTSTWTGDDNLANIEYSIGRVADALAEQVRLRQNDFVGLAAVDKIEQAMKRATIGVLADALRAGWVRQFDPNQVVVTLDNDVIYTDYAFDPVKVINFALSTGHAQPSYGSTVQTQVQLPLAAAV
ncbi:MAG: hypothetical protein HY816_19990 [Candidatus Wallbacteria bacterium]|nr:hypothetical protein [Candidatus Wallbacteria bacterium]